MIKKCNNLHLLPKLCKIIPNYNLNLSNEVTIGANHKFLTSAPNNPRAIAAN